MNYWLTYGLSGSDQRRSDNIPNHAETHISRPRHAEAARAHRWRTSSSWLAAEVGQAQHPVAENHSLDPEHERQARSGTRQGQAERRASMRPSRGQAGRPSKSLTLDQAEAVLKPLQTSPLHAYIVLSLLIGARTEELRALPCGCRPRRQAPRRPALPPSIAVWRAVRAGGDTKTRKSRRTLALSQGAALTRSASTGSSSNTGKIRKRSERVWCSSPAPARRLTRTTSVANFRKVVEAAGLKPEGVDTRELRHSFVSLLSDDGMPVEQHLPAGRAHRTTTVTEKVYRHQIRPVYRGSRGNGSYLPASEQLRERPAC